MPVSYREFVPNGKKLFRCGSTKAGLIEFQIVTIHARGPCTLQDRSAFGAVMRAGRRAAAGAAGVQVEFPSAPWADKQFHCTDLRVSSALKILPGEDVIRPDRETCSMTTV